MTDEIVGQSGQEGVSQETPQEPKSGVSTETPRAEETTDVDLEAKIAAIRAEEKAARERDVGQVKSTLQRQQAELQRQFQEEIAKRDQQIRELELMGLSPEERKAKETQFELEKARLLEQQLYQERALRAQEQAAREWAMFFQQLGIGSDQLDGSSPEALVSSGWQAAARRIRSLEQRLAQAEGQQTPTPSPQQGQTPQRKPAPATATQQGSTPGSRTWRQLEQDLGMTETEIWNALDRGELDPSIIPS